MNNNKPAYVRPENETSYADGTRQHLCITSGGEATDAEYVRVVTAQPYEWTEEEIKRDQERFASRPFSILR